MNHDNFIYHPGILYNKYIRRGDGIKFGQNIVWNEIETFIKKFFCAIFCLAKNHILNIETRCLDVFKISNSTQLSKFKFGSRKSENA